jgi:hypothetical protein
MDLHDAQAMAMQFATYLEGAPAGDCEVELADAVHHQKTYISKGPLLLWRHDAAADRYAFSILDTHKPGYVHSSAPYVLTLTSRAGTSAREVPGGALNLPAGDLGPGDVFYPEALRRPGGDQKPRLRVNRHSPPDRAT